MAVTVSNGETIPATGWYTDPHGHELFLQDGRLAPLCPRFGAVRVRWRLTRPEPRPPADPAEED